ncbi:MAG: hypothetical protein N0C90_18390 [Candidatus Thiodiazotropha endolucinida]|nr:hypothetical protein [Candidatus Thiodiazotropha taylori]MCW4263326.1 hypothetical protein [Candidatus Thiodiazotropha endolucinida]
MKGIFSLQNDTVQIEEFSYPLEEFLLDEPDFKALKNGELTYHRGQGSTLIIEGKQSEAEKDYPSEDIELYIGRKSMYRSAHKARRGAVKPSKAKRSNKKTAKPSANKPAASTKEEKPKTAQTSKPVTEETNNADH